MSISDYSATPASNGAVLPGIDIAENCLPSNLNDALRKIMADLKEGFFTGLKADTGIFEGSLTVNIQTGGGDAEGFLYLDKGVIGDVTSIQARTGGSARMETGLDLNDDYYLKVSTDGVAWTTAMTVANATGVVAFPAGGARRLLTAVETWYVDNALGSDSNDGLSSGAGAFATIQKAVDTIVETVDLAGFVGTIDVNNATYSEKVTLSPLTGGGRVNLTGDTTTPSNVIIDHASKCIDAQGCLEHQWTVKGFKFTGAGIAVNSQYGYLAIESCEFASTGSPQIRALYNAYIHIAANTVFTISASAAYHVQSSSNSDMYYGADVTLTGTPAFATAFAQSTTGSKLAFAPASSFTGAATGKRYTVTDVSTISTNSSGSTYLPGDVAGTVGTNCIYD